ncbi:DUF5979 domain-containing protein [Nocardioides sambongensis]|uniref:DUF5979 domain-containing protein n=1 Tax=Nocardioides sambongensis TaxID=2589074 RepID=UPI0011297274|nr:DUF5979 domain-containing protein [Nocardioides sambongensis]
MRFPFHKIMLMLLVGVLGLGLAVPAAAAPVLPDPDPGDVSSVLDITKSVSSTEVGPGDSISYTIQVGCSAISDVGCRGAITTDVIPEPFVVDSVVPSGPNDSADPVIDGQNVRVDWTENLGAGASGMLDNTTSQVVITVTVPEDVSYDFNGVTVTNEATAEATNAVDVTDSADVTITVPLDLDTSATKVFTPDNALAAAGTPVTAALGGTNDSNATVDTLVIQDPTDPTATPNPFTYLGFTGFGTVTPPAGATGTTYEVYIAPGGWTTVPADYTPPAGTEVLGTRVTFTGAIPPGETGSVDLDLETTAAAAALPETTTITNEIESEVTLDGEDATATTSDDFTVQANTIDVTASKSFDPDLVVAGDSTTVTIGGSNASPFAIDSMTITEPSSGSFPDDYTFAGFTGDVTYPANATSAYVVYQPSGEQVPFDNNTTPGPPSGGNESVTSFSVVFEGEDAIVPGAETSIPFDVQTDADAPGLPTTVNNEVAVEGENDSATGDAVADDDLYIYDEVIDPYIDKQIRPSQIIANPGEIVTVTMEGGTTERPNPPENPDGSTGNADQIVIQDPLDPVEGDEWWNAFDLDAITQTPIPADAELTVEYYNTETGEWETLVGPVPGPDASYNYDVPDDISDVAGGVRFVYDYTGDDGGFQPGTDLAPNFTASLRPADDGRYESPAYNTDPDEPNTQLTDCAQSEAGSPTPGVPDFLSAMPLEDCPDIEIFPLDGEGVGDLLDKEFGTSSSGGDKAVNSRSGDTIPSTLFWSTGGYSGFETVEITDVNNPPSTDAETADTMYDAFNLTRVDAITPAMDPYITYDQVTAVQLWDGSDWVDATNDPCPAACDGTFPGMDLTAAEQESTLSVRLIFAESPTRGDRTAGDLDAPPVGSGVARSIGNDRELTLVWQVRDTKRSDGSPALGEDTYNLDPQTGIVRNTANATGYPADGDPVSDNASDDVVILDVPITMTTAKDWLGGPLAIPSDGTPAAQYPASRIRITTTNTTPAMVDQMQITDPAPGSTTVQDPFEYFTLVRIAAINVPNGTETTTVQLTCGGTTTSYTRAEALALAPADLACVTGVQVLFDGRIASAASGVLALDMRLRPETRTGGDPITTDDAPIANVAQGIVADVDAIADCPPGEDDRYACAEDPATINLVAPTFGIDAGKTISPAQQFEGDYSPVTVTLSAQNSGSARPYLDTITDDDATFWNAMDFVQMDPSWELPQPVQFVQACYLTGGDFTAGNVTADSVGGDWTCQEVPGGGPPFEPGVDLTIDQARDFIDSAPAGDIHGLEFNFMANNEVGWQNPSNPEIEVPFQVERREDLRTGGPVPTTRSDQTAAPGETAAGVFNDTVDVEGVSVLVGPDTRLDAADSADAPYTHAHLEVGVDVEKQPEGEVEPGTVIPFTISYTNTGDAPLTNPVFTDVIESDADGNLLVFDPDATPGTSPYSFELDPVDDPPPADSLPTDEDQITITEDGDTITFAMPDGSVLQPGQTYTITIELMLRPGLTPEDDVTNEGAVIADEPVDPDACTPTYDEVTGECSDDTVVSPVEVAALRTVKKVKADVPVNEPGIPEIYLDEDVIPDGADLPADFCDTAADADGFYRAPCVPVTYPGDTETWRYTITNVGTLPVDELVSIDVLPHVGDTGVIVNLPRDSEWTPTFAGGLEQVPANPDVELTAFYSTSYTPCTDDLDPLGTPCPDGSWLPYDDSVDPSQVHSLKTVLAYPDGSLFQPGDSVTLQAQTRTTPESRALTDYPVAWNTVATGGAYNNQGDRGSITETEGRKVGVTYPTGPIELEKNVLGPGAEFAPDEFTVQLTCTVPDGDGGTIEMTDLPEVTLVPGADPTEIEGLPWGAECTATETDQGQTSEVIGDATVGGPDDEIGLITVNNFFTVGALSVTKDVQSDAVDQGGDEIAYDGPYTVAVDCTFLGDAVYADGYDVDNPMTAELSPDVPFTFVGLPTGAECTVTETDDGGAADVTINPPQPVTIGNGDIVAVSVTNVFGDGSLRLLKEVDGAAIQNNPGLADGPFTFDVSCVLTDPSHPDGTVVYDDEVVLPDDDNVDNDVMDYQIDDLATGAVCEVTETGDGGATSVAVDPEEVTIGDETTVEVTVTNTFDTGSMQVTKEVDSDAVDQDGNPIEYGPFEVFVVCAASGGQVYGDGYSASNPMRHTIADGETWTISGLPLGATCTTVETDTADSADHSVEPGVVNIGGPDGDPDVVELVTVTNSYDVGSLDLLKEVEGDALDNNPALGEGPFTLNVECTLTDATRPDGEVVYDGDVVLEGEAPLEATIDDLPTGAVCDITEPDQGGATSYTIDPEQVTIGTDTAVEVTATNTYEVGDMEVVKTVTSDAVDQDGNPIEYGPFQVAVSCELNGHEVWADGYDADTPMTQEIEPGTPWELTELPVGAECTVTEPDSADAVEVTITPETVVIDQDETASVEVDNAYDVGSLHLRKFVPAALQDLPIGQGPFTINVSCVLTDASHPDGTIVYDDDIVLPDDDNVANDVMDYQIDNLATGAVCTVTEPDDGAANAHIITPRTVTIGADRTSNVLVTNLFGAGALTVTKTIDGPGAELYGAGPFEVSVECTYTDVNGNEQPLNTAGGPTRELSADNDYTATYDPLLFGSTCTIEETGTGGATETVITDADGEEIDQITIDSLTEDVQVGITNTFRVGRVKVTKQVKGPGAGPFSVELACTRDVDGTATDVDIPGGAERRLTRGNDLTAVYEMLPAGAECTVEETDDGGADEVTITPNDGDESVGVLTVEPGATARVKVVNTFDRNPGVGPDGGSDGDDLPDAGADGRLLPALVIGLALLLLGAGALILGRRRS